jgi:hypothetical protein
MKPQAVVAGTVFGAINTTIATLLSSVVRHEGDKYGRRNRRW